MTTKNMSAIAFCQFRLKKAAIASFGLALASILPIAPAVAADRSIGATYEVFLNGLKLGEGSMAATMNDKDYTIKGFSKVSGLAGALIKFRAAGTANGRMVGADLRPSGFAATTVSRKKTVTTQISMRGGNVASVALNPPIDLTGKVPITHSHHRGITDPMSAMIVPMRSKNLLDPKNCQRTIPIFNGRERFNVKLSYKRTAKIDASGATNNATEAIICQARYQPIAGHRAGRKEVEYFRNQRGIELWLIAAGDTGVMLPYRITVPTPIGNGMVQMTGLSAKGNSRTAMR